jgi:hypothetical protein
MMRRPKTPEVALNSDNADSEIRRCAADGCVAEGIYPAPKSRHALRDYIWFCLDHVRAYNKSWNYYEGLEGAALEAEIRRATTWERPSWKFATGKPANEIFDDSFGIFDFESRGQPGIGRTLSVEEQRAWKTLQMNPVPDVELVKKRYKQLAKETHPDKNGGDAKAEERLKEINLAYALICKSLSANGATTS